MPLCLAVRGALNGTFLLRNNLNLLNFSYSVGINQRLSLHATRHWYKRVFVRVRPGLTLFLCVCVSTCLSLMLILVTRYDPTGGCYDVSDRQRGGS